MKCKGLPWWSSGKESAFQCRGCGFGQGTKISRASGKLSPQAATTELGCLNERARMPQTTEPTCPGACVPQPERENPHATTREKPACHNERSRILQ